MEQPPPPPPPSDPYQPPQAQGKLSNPQQVGSPYPIQGIVRVGKLIVLDRFGHQLPTAPCFKCNAPTTSIKSKLL